MRSSMILRRVSTGTNNRALPTEVYPLIICMAGVSIAAGYRLYTNYMGEEVRSGHQNQETARLPESNH